MALAKRTLVFAIVGVIVLVIGLGGGIYLGLKFLTPEQPVQVAAQVAAAKSAA